MSPPRRWRSLLDRVGGALRPRARTAPPAPNSLEIEAIRARLDRLEAMVEGVQDAVYHASQRHDAEIEDLRNRLQPAEIARALSEDERRRGL